MRSVVIPHHGDPNPTSELVAMLHAGAPDAASIEVIVVDDGSPEPLGPLPGARVLRLDQDKGFGHAVNAGVRACTGDVVLVLNGDLRPAPGFVEALVREAQPEFPALTSPTIAEGGVVMENATECFPTVWSTVASRSALPVIRNRVRPAEMQTRTGNGNREVAWVSGAALCFQRRVFERAGGFDEDFFMYLEDVDLQFQTSLDGDQACVAGTHLGRASGCFLEHR